MYMVTIHAPFFFGKNSGRITSLPGYVPVILQFQVQQYRWPCATATVTLVFFHGSTPPSMAPCVERCETLDCSARPDLLTRDAQTTPNGCNEFSKAINCYGIKYCAATYF